MCNSYGVCNDVVSVSPSPPPLQLEALRAPDVADFIKSIGDPNGSRQTCPPNCSLLAMFNGSSFVQHGVDGAVLARWLREHEARFTSSVKHNATERAAHGRWLGSLFPWPSGAKPEQYIALTVRLRAALIHSGASL